ncbi:MAG TPA: Hint domain-containing protein [Acetobacteraceae bacterium]|jgi:hypothetical protein
MPTSISFGTGTFSGFPDSTATLSDPSFRTSYSPFSDVSFSGTTPGNLTVRVAIADPTPGQALQTVYLPRAATLIGGTQVSHYTFGTVTYSGSAAEVQSFLRGIYFTNSQALGSTDLFKLQVRVTDASNNTGSILETFLTPTCFARGTAIGTPDGAVAVEKLAIGDLVTTRDGSAKPVKWIGRRSYAAGVAEGRPSLRPVIIRTGALGANIPARDLHVSSMHAMHIDDVLVPAASLVNGASVLRSETNGPIEYFHVELHAHDVIFAEGAPTESYGDCDSRALFDNAAEYAELYGTGEAEAEFAAPRVEEGYLLEAVRGQVAARAGLAAAQPARGALRGLAERIEDGILEGWALAEGEAPVELEVCVDGEAVARVLANRYRTDLDDAGLRGGRCGFTVAMPASVTSLEQVAVRRLADGAALLRLEPALAA